MNSNSRRKKRLTAADSGASDAREPLARRMFITMLLAVLLTAVALRIYKAHHTGIIYDEAGTYRDFSHSISDALTKYNSPNNHVINSIAIHFAAKPFGSYEHFIRIPAVFSSLMFLAATAYIICKTIDSGLLRLGLVAVISLNYYVFDLSILARGFAIALGVIYTGMGLALYLLDRPIKYRWWFVPILLLVITNFLAVGSMLATVFLLVGLNVVAVCFSARFFSNAPNRRNPTLLTGICVPVLSAGALLLLFWRLREKIQEQSQAYGKISTLRYFRQVLVDPLLGRADGLRGAAWPGGAENMADGAGWMRGALVWTVLVIVLVSGAVVLVSWLRGQGEARNHRRKGDTTESKADGPAALCRTLFGPAGFVVAVLCVTVLAMIAHSDILRKPLGNVRHGFFLIPLVVISLGILIDRALKCISANVLGKIFLGVVLVAAVGLTVQSWPSTYVVQIHNWDRQSMIGPLLRRLRAIDPQHVWNISLSKETRYNWQSLEYYDNFGYRSRFRGVRTPDVVIRHKSEGSAGGIYLDKDYFDKFNCVVQMNPARIKNEVFLQDRLTRQ